MPELPEVETVRRTLEQLVIGKQIEHVSVNLPRIIRQPEMKTFQQQLSGTTISAIERRGKFLKLICKPWVLISHLRMEGKYRLNHADDPLDKHTHVIFHFVDGTELRYLDVRQFGTMDLLSYGTENEQPPLNKLGLEPLSEQFTVSWLQQKLAQKKAKIKPLLLNQELLVGLGNIYVDESLYRAGIHPERTANSLTAEEITRLHKQIVEVLSTAIEAGGSSVRSYVNGEGEMGRFQLQIQVYGKKNEPCLHCSNLIERIVVAGRGTHICPTCQRL